MLTVENLRVSYDRITALHGISFRIEEGERVCIIGANGAGKSTTLRAISRMVPVAAGTRMTYMGKDLLTYAAGKKVIPVSPNLLYAYLMTIVMGLHGLRIEKQAAEIRANLERLTGGLSGFLSHWEILGRHLRNAQGQYEEGQVKLNRFTLQLEQIRRPDEPEEAGPLS